MLRTIWRHCKRLVNLVRGHDLYVRADVTADTVTIESRTAAWTIATDRPLRDKVAYAVGVGTDIEFDETLVRRFGMQVHSFDPTPRSVAWIRNQVLPAGMAFHEIGLSDQDGFLEFEEPANPEHASFSTVTQRSGRRVRLPVKRLGTIMKDLHHEEIEILKMDVEGAEYGIISDMERCGLWPRQLLVEFHHRFPSIGAHRTRDAIRILKRAGYRIARVEPNGEEFLFLRFA